MNTILLALDQSLRSLVTQSVHMVKYHARTIPSLGPGSLYIVVQCLKQKLVIGGTLSACQAIQRLSVTLSCNSCSCVLLSFMLFMGAVFPVYAEVERRGDGTE